MERRNATGRAHSWAEKHTETPQSASSVCLPITHQLLKFKPIRKYYFVFYSAVIKILDKRRNKSTSKSLFRQLKTCGFWKHLHHSCFFSSVCKTIITWHQNLSWGKARSQSRSSAMNLARSKNSSTKAGSLTTGGGLYSTKDRSALISGCCRKPKHCIKTRDQVAGMPSSHLHCWISGNWQKNYTIIQSVIQFSGNFPFSNTQIKNSVSSQPYFSAVFSDLHNSADDVTCTLLTKPCKATLPHLQTKQHQLEIMPLKCCLRPLFPLSWFSNNIPKSQTNMTTKYREETLCYPSQEILNSLPKSPHPNMRIVLHNK